MDQLSRQLGALFIGSVPTILIFIVLHFYLRGVLYRPLQRVLRERKTRTEGELEIARQKMSLAEQKLREYEAAIQATREANYQLLTERRQQALHQGQQTLAEARQQAETALQAARQQVAEQVTSARQQLNNEARQLSTQVINAVLETGAASAVNPGVGA